MKRPSHPARFSALLALIVACGDSESATTQCDPQASRECECAADASGTSICGENGAWGACVCNEGGGSAGGSGAEAGGGQGAGAPTNCDQAGSWFDPLSGLCWQAEPTSPPLFAPDAVGFCAKLASDGRSDWRLPDISELRSLIRGCPETELGGVCGVTATCTGIECEDDEDCLGCVYQAGPGPGGCYWDAALGESCDKPSWSSSPEVNDYVWAIDFESGYITERFEEEPLEVRCVRTP